MNLYGQGGLNGHQQFYNYGTWMYDYQSIRIVRYEILRR